MEELLTNIFLTAMLIFSIDVLLIKTDFFPSEEANTVVGFIAFIVTVIAIICLFVGIWI